MWMARRQLEDAVDQRNAELIDLRKAALEHAVASPIKPSSHLQSALGAWGHATLTPARSEFHSCPPVQSPSALPLACLLHGSQSV